MVKSKAKRRNVLFSSIIILLITILSVGLVCYYFTTNNKPSMNVASAKSTLPSQESETVESLREVSADIKFEINSEFEITNNNLSDFVSITDFHSNEIEISVFQKNGHYIINPPIGLYVAGQSYRISLENAKFVEKQLENNQCLIFTIAKETVEKISIKKIVRDIPSDEIIAINEDSLILASDIYSIGDILIFTSDFEGYEVKEVRKVIDKIYSENKLVLMTEIPSMDEVYDEIEINGNYNPKIEDVIIYGEDQIEEEIINLPSVMALSYAVNAYNAGSEIVSIKPMNGSFSGGGDIGINGNGKLKPLSVKLSVKNVKVSPFQAEGSISISWEIDKAKYSYGNIKATLSVTIAFSIKVESYVSSSSNGNEYKNGTITTTTFTIKTELTASAKSQMKDIYRLSPLTNGYGKKDSSLERYVKGIDDKKYTDNNAIYYLRETNAQYRDLTQCEKEQIIGELNALSKVYKSNKNGTPFLGNDILPIAQFPIPLPAGFCLYIKAGFVISIDIQATFGVSYQYKSIQEDGQITTEDGSTTYSNQYTCHSVSAYVTGSIGIKLGVGLEVKLTFAKVFYASFGLQIGGYLDLNGSLICYFGDEKNDEIFAGQLIQEVPNSAAAIASPTLATISAITGEPIYGFGSVDFGYFYTATLKVGAKFEILGIGIDISASISYGDKVSLKKYGKEPDKYSDLVSEDEINGSLESIFDEAYLEKNDNSMSVRTFETGKSSVQMPKIFKRTIDLTNAKVFYEYISPSRIRYSNNVNVGINSEGLIFQNDTSIQEIDEMIWITATDLNGFESVTEWTYLHIRKDPIKVENVTLSYNGNGITVGGSDSVNVSFEPSNASYKDVAFFIEYVIKDGEKISTNLSDYASISTTGMITVYEKLAVGDKIGVRAKAKIDEVDSNIIDVPIVKTSVREVRIVPKALRSDIQPGGSLKIEASISPITATNKKATFTVISGEEFGYIGTDGETLYCYAETRTNSEIKVIATVDGISSPEFIFRVGAIPVESAIIKNKSTDSELEKITNIQLGATIDLEALAYPQNTTELRNYFVITKNSNFATIDENGSLTVSNNKNCIGQTIKILTNYGGVNSREYEFVIDKIPIEAIDLYTYNDITTIMPGERLQFYANVKPNNATYFNINYSIIDGEQYAQINSYGALTVFTDAEIGQVIKVHSEIDGIYSNIITLTIVKIPIESLHIGAPNNVTLINENQKLQLISNVTPINASNKNLVFEIIEGSEYANIDNNGLIIVKNNIGNSDAKISIRANADDVYSNILTFNIYVPVREVYITTDKGKIAEIHLGEYVNLITTINPTYSTKSDVVYELTNNAEYAQLDQTFGYLSVNYDTNALGKILGIVAIVDGVRSSELFIKIVKVPVAKIELGHENNIKVGIGQTYQLSAYASPINATYSNITYTIIENGAKAIINNDILTVPSTAKAGDIVKIIAKADNVESEILNVVIVPVQVAYLKINSEKTKLLPDEQIQIHGEVNKDATDKIIQYRIVSGNAYANITNDGLLTINELIPIRNAVVTIKATAGGVESNELSFNVYVPVSFISLQASTYEVSAGSGFYVTWQINENATEQNIILDITGGAEYIESVVGNYYKVKHVDIPDAVIRFRANSQGIESHEISINVIVPVASVSINVNNSKPKQGDTITFSHVVLPYHASNQTTTYEVLNPINGLVIDAEMGTLTIASTVPVGTEIFIRGVADNVSSNVITLIVQKIPVENVILSINDVKAIMQGESVHLFVNIMPQSATYKNITYKFLEGANYAEIIKSEVLSINKNAQVGARIRVVAIVDGIESNTIEVIVLKVPVTEIQINAGGITVARPGEKIQFFGKVNEDATYKSITYSLLGEQQYATITASGLLTIKDIVSAENAVIRVVGTADGVRSEYYEISIFNPVTEIITFTAKTTLIPGESFTVTASVNANATNKNVNFIIVSGYEFVEIVGDGQFKIKNNITTKNANIVIRAVKDGVISKNDIVITVYIAVENVKIVSGGGTLHQNETIYLNGIVEPVYASKNNIVYSIFGNPVGVSLNSSTGELKIGSNATVGGIFSVIASVDGKDSQTYNYTIESSLLYAENGYSIIEKGKSIRIYAGNSTDLVNVTLNVSTSVATVSKIAGNEWIVSVSQNAIANTNITINASINSKISTITIIVVNQIPVTKVTASHNAPAQILQGSKIQIAPTVYPQNASNKNVVYSIINSNGNIATVNTNGLITVNSSITVSNPKFTVRIASLENSNIFYDVEFLVYIPLNSFTISYTITSSADNSGQITSTSIKGSTISLGVNLNPVNANIGNTEYKIKTGTNFGKVDANILSIYSNITQSNASICVLATIGEKTAEITFNIIIPVENVTISSVTLKQSGDETQSAQYQVSAIANQSYATNRTLSYSISSFAASYASISSTGLLTLTKDTPNNFSFTITVTANNGVYATYPLNQANATSLSVSRVARQSGNVSINWNGVRDTDNTVSYTTNKAKPGDVLNIETAFVSIPTFKNYEVSIGTGYTVNADKHSITINSLNTFTSDIPKITVKIKTLHNNPQLTASVDIYIYLPVESISVNIPEKVIKRGIDVDISSYISYNNGYATNKSFTISGMTGNASNSNTTKSIKILANTAGGTEFKFNIVTKDKTFTGNSVSVAMLDNTKFELEYGTDSKNSITVKTQLQNGSNVYVTPVYNDADYINIDLGGKGKKPALSLLGVSITSDITYKTTGLSGVNSSGVDDVTAKVLTNDSVKKIQLVLATYVNGSSSKGEISGNNNYFTYKVTLNDGTTTSGKKEISNTIYAFNKITANDDVYFSTGQYDDNNKYQPLIYSSCYYNALSKNSLDTVPEINLTLVSLNSSSMSWSFATRYMTCNFSTSNGLESSSFSAEYTAFQTYNGQQIYSYSTSTTIMRRFITGQSHLTQLNGKEGKWYIVKNITLSGNWTPIASFNGTLFGQGYSIDSLKISIPDTKYTSDQYFGLFATLNKSAIVQNIRLTNISITTAGAKHEGSGVFVGAVAGKNIGTIYDVDASSGTISIDRVTSNVGGLVGVNYGTVEWSYSYIKIRGNGNLGGNVGKNENGGKVLRCSASSATVSIYSINATSVGGIVGWNCSGGEVKDSAGGAYMNFENTVDVLLRAGTIIGHNQGTFDNKGYTAGSSGVNYTYSNGFLGIGKYNNGQYLFANNSERVGKVG